ncbi:thiol-disulfide oxidoreductase DCC family protein [Thiomicrospira microaerophila]|uniref:thiol-disulfide oxidoreductase DCC family protein n=1 Tax=Thiomicrospira microaerophila TaxID=406020 RepID=UPI0005C928C1|nr:DUF393 domain-containing protein [Thiomicrospira microaerophila]
MINVFYDGQCGLCSKEINHYKKIAPPGVFHWQDIATLSPNWLEQEGITQVELLKHLHAKDDTGKMHVGVDAFLLMWRQLKRWRILAGIVSLPGIYTLTRQIYHGFAQWRFKRLPHCQIALKNQSH